MECPKCCYEPTVAEQTASPDICPSCGVVYAKASAAAAASVGGVAGAKAAVAAGRKARLEQEGLAKLRSEHPGYVIVTDINMPFWSMVQFMVKLSLAAIPAAIILGILFAGVLSVFRLL